MEEANFLRSLAISCFGLYLLLAAYEYIICASFICLFFRLMVLYSLHLLLGKFPRIYKITHPSHIHLHTGIHRVPHPAASNSPESPAPIGSDLVSRFGLSSQISQLIPILIYTLACFCYYLLAFYQRPLHADLKVHPLSTNLPKSFDQGISLENRYNLSRGEPTWDFFTDNSIPLVVENYDKTGKPLLFPPVSNEKLLALGSTTSCLKDDKSKCPTEVGILLDVLNYWENVLDSLPYSIFFGLPEYASYWKLIGNNIALAFISGILVISVNRVLEIVE